ncbi:hypothetical protein ACNKHX_00165 [Shigella flexneri]
MTAPKATPAAAQSRGDLDHHPLDLPANRGIAMHTDLDYALVQVEGHAA